jgi:hypothetical protein
MLVYEFPLSFFLLQKRGCPEFGIENPFTFSEYIQISLLGEEHKWINRLNLLNPVSHFQLSGYLVDG